jgi:hypothetical protein
MRPSRSALLRYGRMKKLPRTRCDWKNSDIKKVRGDWQKVRDDLRAIRGKGGG